MGRFTGKTVMISGGTSGIGRACAERFAEEGAAVAILGRNENRGNAIVEAIRSTGGVASFHAVDVTRRDQVTAAFGALLDRYGQLDVAFNNAGISGGAGEFDDVSHDEFDLVMQTNVYSVFHCMKLQIRHFLETGGGAIVNCSSIGGLVGAINQSSYVTSKHAIVGLTRASALEYASRNIRINAICPGGVATPLLRSYLAGVPKEKRGNFAPPALGRAQPGEISGLVVFLCSDDASNIIGQAYAIDGGLTAA